MSVKTITLTQGKSARVDDADYAFLSQWKWCAMRQVTRKQTVWYAVRSVRTGPKNVRVVYMHREIAAISSLPHVDHQDNDGLNNQRLNLRPATCSQNLQNQRKRPGCSSSFKGVWHDRKNGKWHAQIKARGQKRHLGTFTNESEAAEAYASAAYSFFGQFANCRAVVIEE